MPTQDQLIEIPIASGLDGKTDALLRTGLSSCVNGVYRKAGAISKRYGMAALTTSAATFDPSGIGGGPASVPFSQWVGTCGDELVEIGSGYVHAYAPGSTAAPWAYRGSAGEFQGKRRHVSGGDADIYSTDMAEFTDSGVTYQVVAYAVNQTQPSGVDTNCVYVTVLRTDSGALVLPRTFIGKRSAVTGVGNRVRVVVSGGYAHLFWDDGGAVRCASLLTSSIAAGWSASSTLANIYNAAPTGRWDVASTTTSQIALGYVSTTATPVTLAFLTSTTAGCSVSFTLTDGGSSSANRPTALGVATKGVASEAAIVYAYTTTGGVLTICALFASSGIVLQNGQISSKAGVAVASGPIARTIPRAIDAVMFSGTSAYYVCSVVSLAPQGGSGTPFDGLAYGGWNPTSGASLTGANPTIAPGVRLVSKLVRHSTTGSTYAVAMNQGDTGSVQTGTGSSTYMLLDVSTLMAVTPSRYNPRLVSVVGPGLADSTQAFARGFTSGTVTWYDNNPAALTQSGNDMVIALPFKTPLAAHGDVQAVRFAYAPNPIAVDTNGSLVIAGGVTSVYDGATTFEAGFAYEVPTFLAGLAFGGSGGLGTGTYSYALVPEYTDARGQRHQGAPSLPITGAATSGQAATLTFPPMSVTNREVWFSIASQPARPIQFAVYRTALTGGVQSTQYYRVGQVQNNLALATLTLIDSLSDATAQAGEVLYATLAGELGNTIAPSAGHVALHQGACVLTDTDDGTVWYSKAFREGSGIGFTPALTNPQPSGGVVASGSLDERLILLGPNRVFVQEGAMPNDLGVGTLQPPRDLSSAVGCVEKRSLVNGPSGLYFQAGDYSVWCVGRGLDVQPVGKPVEDFTGLSSRRFCAGVLYAAHGMNHMLFAIENKTSGSDVMVLNVLLGSWTSLAYSDPVNLSGTSGKLRGMCMWRGTLTLATAQIGGIVYTEDRTTYIDTGGGNTLFAPLSLITGEVRVAGLNGYERVKRLGMLARGDAGHAVPPHGITMAVTTDDETGAGFTQTVTWTAADLAALTYERLQVRLVNQKCNSFRVFVTDVDPGAGTRGTGQGPTFAGLSALVGLKKGTRKVSAVAQR